MTQNEVKIGAFGASKRIINTSSQIGKELLFLVI
jgi:hypothetical protein